METNQMPMHEKSSGALIGSIVIVIILIVGGIYLWKNAMEKKSAEENSTSSDYQSVDNTAASMDAELNSMDFDSLDSGI